MSPLLQVTLGIGEGCGARSGGLLTICGQRDKVQTLVKDAVPTVGDCSQSVGTATRFKHW